MKTIILQNATEGYKRLLLLTAEHHYRHAARLNYSILFTHQHRNPERHVSWEKVYMFRDAIRQGYERIVWLDADTLWLGDPIETGQTAPLGMAWHQGDEYDHYNAGVMVLQVGDKLSSFIDEWIASEDGGHKWWEQHPMNMLIRQKPELACPIGAEWNSVQPFPHLRADNPKIVAWHGRPTLAYDGIMEWLTR